MVQDPLHVYLDRLLAPAGAECHAFWSKLQGHQQVTDSYLLSVATASGAKLLTFDRRAAILGARERIEVIGV